MTVPIQSIEESLSVSYVSSVVGRSGASFNIVLHDFGVDVSVRRVESYRGQLMDMGVSFDCQLKATINWIEEHDSIAYDLDATTYNKLVYRRENSTTPCLLVLLCLPREQENWLSITDNELKLRKCCYYYYINGNETNNSTSIRIRIPKTNIFSPDAVLQLMERVRTGELA